MFTCRFTLIVFCDLWMKICLVYLLLFLRLPLQTCDKDSATWQIWAQKLYIFATWSVCVYSSDGLMAFTSKLNCRPSETFYLITSTYTMDNTGKNQCQQTVFQSNEFHLELPVSNKTNLLLPNWGLLSFMPREFFSCWQE